jgi:predicted house-cleaning noncanonical NTP pyrophosphatase (MazG superfamily)
VRRKSNRLVPHGRITFVSSSEPSKLPATSISWQNVGQKAYGLAALPRAWTLPFFVVSPDLFDEYRRQKNKREKTIAKWAPAITRAAQSVGIHETDEIVVRSSGSSEGMARRGNLYSATGDMRNISSVIRSCLAKLTDDTSIADENIPLLIQKRCFPRKARGHLSNERRCYKESRDWMGEFEVSEAAAPSQFQINIRHWRKKFRPNVNNPLTCSLSALISEVLKHAAEWASQKNARVHFEWVWDGRRVYLVQADEEPTWAGHDPVKEHRGRQYNPISFTPSCLQRVTTNHARRFRKIANAFIYSKLGLETAPLYILDDQKVIQELAKGKPPTGLTKDISKLVTGSLVIRTDIGSDDIAARQLLPRTQEIRDQKTAIDWLVMQSKRLCSSGYNGAFIFHNFIPAQSAAFAYADPKSPFVQIESLWGLPEGLYYNSHDQFMVDTVKRELKTITPSDVQRFSIRERPNFKRFFVSTTPTGKWQTLTLKAPYDWQRSISEGDCRRIAYDSRRIAAMENHPVSVMWFIGVPPAVAKEPAIPWYHEAYDLTGRQPSITTRTKTLFDRSFVIRSPQDVEQLKAADFVTPQNRIRVQPSDESLLRDKTTLKTIGEIAKSKGAIIVLEGGILSHAYYQLLQTGAIVEVAHPFIGFEERHEFNKLVRDRVPDLIRQRGERVTTARLNEEAAERALRQKLVEEAYELLDAKDLGAVRGEIADIKEIIEALMKRLKASGRDVNEEQKRKRRQLGGFQKGIVLVETESQPPTARRPHQQLDLQGVDPDKIAPRPIDEAEFRRRSESLERRRPDRLVSSGKTELRLNIAVPVTRQHWSVDTGEERIQGTRGKTIAGRMKGTRQRARWTFEISIMINASQPELL